MILCAVWPINPYLFANSSRISHKTPVPARRHGGASAKSGSVELRHRAAAAGAEGAAAGAGGAAVGALAHSGGAHRVHRAAGVAAAGGAAGGAVAPVARRLTHGFQRAGGLGEQGQAEEFISHIMLPLKRQLNIASFFRGDTGIQG